MGAFLRIARHALTMPMAVLALVCLPSLAAAAPGGVAYLEGGHVWVSNLDGSKKVQLSSGDAWWNAVTQSAGGGVLATKNEPLKIAQLSAFQTWDASGDLARFGPLNHNAFGASLAMPLSLAMTSSNGVMLYGYSAFFPGFPVGTLRQGFYQQSTQTAAVGPPINGESGLQYPSLAGDRVVGVSGTTSLAVVNADQGFTGNQTTPWYSNLDFSATGAGAGIRRTSLSSTGAVMAAEIEFDGPNDRVLLVKSVDLGGAYVDDCWVPAVGEATSGSVSPDGTRIAWKDSEGVKVAGAPDFAGPVTCNLTSPPVVVAAAGKDPALGPIDVDAIWAARNPALPPAPQPTQPTTQQTSPSILTLPTIPKLAVSGLATPGGASLTVSVPAAGKVTCTATVRASRIGRKGSKPVVVGTCAAVNAATAGSVTLKLRLNAVGRKAKKRLRGAKVTIKITQGAKTITKVITLR